MRLIDAEKLQRVFNEVSTSIMREPKMTKDMEHIVRACIMTTEIINDAPTIEAVPVKHGRWISKGIWIECSNCKKALIRDNIEGAAIYENGLPEYCPRCGAKMDGGEVE